MTDAKKKWQKPQVTSLGRFGEITQSVEVCDKRFGGSDGFTFMGQAIECATGS